MDPFCREQKKDSDASGIHKTTKNTPAFGTRVPERTFCVLRCERAKSQILFLESWPSVVLTHGAHGDEMTHSIPGGVYIIGLWRRGYWRGCGSSAPPVNEPWLSMTRIPRINYYGYHLGYYPVLGWRWFMMIPVRKWWHSIISSLWKGVWRNYPGKLWNFSGELLYSN